MTFRFRNNRDVLKIQLGKRTGNCELNRSKKCVFRIQKKPKPKTKS